jgi:GTPase SAR1 family protein
MGKGCKVVICGLLSVGKTAILEQLLYGNHTIGKIIFLSSFLDSEAGGRCLLLILTGVKEQVRTSNLGSADIQQCLLNVLYMLETNGK